MKYKKVSEVNKFFKCPNCLDFWDTETNELYSGEIPYNSSKELFEFEQKERTKQHKTNLDIMRSKTIGEKCCFLCRESLIDRLTDFFLNFKLFFRKAIQ